MKNSSPISSSLTVNLIILWLLLVSVHCIVEIYNHTTSSNQRSTLIDQNNLFFVQGFKTINVSSNYLIRNASFHLPVE